MHASGLRKLSHCRSCWRKSRGKHQLLLLMGALQLRLSALWAVLQPCLWPCTSSASWLLLPGWSLARSPCWSAPWLDLAPAPLLHIWLVIWHLGWPWILDSVLPCSPDSRIVKMRSSMVRFLPWHAWFDSWLNPACRAASPHCSLPHMLHIKCTSSAASGCHPKGSFSNYFIH